MGDWDAWIGRTETRMDRLDAGMATRWLAMLDRDVAADGVMPQAIHWALCLPDAPTAQLGPDGHPLRDDSPDSFLPPVPLPRRMWASSKVAFFAPLKIDDTITRTSKVLSVTAKSGGSGDLVFVEVEHQTNTQDGPAVREVQSIVYRGAAPAGSAPVPPPPGSELFDPTGWDAHRTLVPTEPLLFRFSALTFNSHRIHYDLPYATDVERYRGLVVHGPLTATLMLDLASRQFGNNALSGFAFRGLSPAICGELLHLVMRENDAEIEFGAFADDGRAVMAASAIRKI